MIDELLRLSTGELGELASALRSGRLDAPYTPTNLQRLLSGAVAAALAPALQRLGSLGFAPAQIAAAVDLVARDRTLRRPLEETIDLVTTGPDARNVTNRSTSVVVRELFSNATTSVLIAGYAVYQGHTVFQSLADRMRERPEVKARLFLDVQRGPGDSSSENELIRRFGANFRTQQWPQNHPLPAVYCDPRSLGVDKRSSLHAKCVVVDLCDVFVSSANFTEAAQQRNIEVGLLIRDRPLAERITFFFDSLVDQDLLVPVL
jgi:phosphatidylserine/phosphatidylglycerophosphate/cardiolipin synthase-like enzyme